MHAGCGIGVLFRMVWVFALLLFRGGRTSEPEEAEYALVVEHAADVERRFPPKYESIEAAPAYVDEKARDQSN
jgi:hypothetical protein